MDTAEALELRIHSGEHAGASEALGEQNHVLGADPACDFVLGDAGLLPQQVRLEFGAAAWRLLHCGDATDKADDAVDLAPGVLHRAGPVVISIDHADAPWPQAGQISALLNRPALDADLIEVAVPPAIEEAADPVIQAQDEEPAAVLAPEQEPQRKPPRSLSRPLIGSLLAVIVGALVWVVVPKTPLKAGNAQAKVAAAPATQAAGSRAAIEAIILAQGLAGRVSTESEASGQIRVRAALLSEDEYEKLALALSALRPRPAMSATTEQDLQTMVAEALARESAELGTPLTAKHTGGGNFRIEGTLRDSAERSALLGRLKTALPAGVLVESALLTPEDLAQGLLEELRGADFAGLKGEWREGRLQMSISLTQDEVPNWEQHLSRVARKYKVPFNVSLALQEKTLSKKLPKGLASLPFQLQSVVSGATPYVVIDGGVKVLLDGRAQGWRLVSVNPAAVEFEGDHAKRVVVER